MGCCHSSETEDEDVRGGPINHSYGHAGRPNSSRAAVANEKTPLLRDNRSIRNESSEKEKEREAMSEVVKQATENLINISSDQSNRIGTADASDRTEKYRKSLGQTPLPRLSLMYLPVRSSSIGLSSSELLVQTPLTPSDHDIIQSHSSNVAEAHRSMKIKDVGPIVTALPSL